MKTRVVKVSNGYVPQVYHWWHGWRGVDRQNPRFGLWSEPYCQLNFCLHSSEELAQSTIDRHIEYNKNGDADEAILRQG